MINMFRNNFKKGEDCPLGVKVRKVGDNQRIGRGLGLGIGRRAGLGQGRGFGRGRKRGFRNINFTPTVTFFKPNGIPLRELEIIDLDLDEFEALRLKNVENLNQVEAGEKMGVSQSTFARILDSANKKVAIALVKGYGIQINNN